jgi:hypothetical protein
MPEILSGENLSSIVEPRGAVSVASLGYKAPAT